MNAQLIANLGWTLLDFVWQGAVIACVTAALLALLRNAAPQTRYAVGCVALLLCLAWPLANLLLLSGAANSGAGDLPRTLGPAPVFLLGGGGLLDWFGQHLRLVVGAWAACAGVLGLRMALGVAWIARVMRTSRTDPYWQARLSQLATRFGLARGVRLRVMEGLSSPVTVGCLRPVVIVPASLLTGMPPELLEALLAHELAHIARHDYLMNLLQNIVEMLLFYHPAVWWLSRRVRVERELVADAVAAEQLGEPRRLALALSELVRQQAAPGGLALAASGGDLAARVRRLVRPERQALQWKAALPVLGLALACLANANALATAEPGDDLRNRPAMIDFASCAKPQYPQADLDALHEGAVDIEFEVMADGAVVGSRVGRSSGYPGLDEAARGAISKCRFHPALKDGRPIALWTPVRYVWALK